MFFQCIVHAHLNGCWIILDPVLDRRTYNAFFLPAGVAWGIDWDAESDMSLYRESVVGEPSKYSDIDKAIQETIGNLELPSLITKTCYRYLNRRLWRRAGITPLSSSPEGWVQ